MDQTIPTNLKYRNVLINCGGIKPIVPINLAYTLVNNNLVPQMNT